MKRLTAFCLVVALTSCAAHPNRTTKCPPAHFTYVGTERVDGLTYGRFQVTHNADQPLQLWVDERRRLNSRTARAEMRRTGGDAWRPYNVILEEITPGAIGLSIGQGEQQSDEYPHADNPGHLLLHNIGAVPKNHTRDFADLPFEQEGQVRAPSLPSARCSMTAAGTSLTRVRRRTDSVERVVSLRRSLERLAPSGPLDR